MRPRLLHRGKDGSPLCRHVANNSFNEAPAASPGKRVKITFESMALPGKLQ
jgi:hypothetical protein